MEAPAVLQVIRMRGEVGVQPHDVLSGIGAGGREVAHLWQLMRAISISRGKTVTHLVALEGRGDTTQTFTLYLPISLSHACRKPHGPAWNPCWQNTTGPGELHFGKLK